MESRHRLDFFTKHFRLQRSRLQRAAKREPMIIGSETLNIVPLHPKQDVNVDTDIKAEVEPLLGRRS